MLNEQITVLQDKVSIDVPLKRLKDFISNFPVCSSGLYFAVIGSIGLEAYA